MTVPADMELSEAARYHGWTPAWIKALPSEFGPRHWARWNHPTGYSVGEVDAGRYMAAGPDGNGLTGTDGLLLEWSDPEDAMKHINNLSR